MILKTQTKVFRKHFLRPIVANKPRNWIQSILCQKEIMIEYFYPNSNSNQPTFNKCIVKTVLSPRDWD